MVKKLLLTFACSACSFAVLAIILGIFAYTGATPFGEFLDVISQNEGNPSDIFMEENYYEVFGKALNFVLYFVISPIIICTGVVGALIAKHDEMFVGLVAIVPMLLVYIIPVCSLKNVLLSLFCIVVTFGCVSLIKRKRSARTPHN